MQKIYTFFLALIAFSMPVYAQTREEILEFTFKESDIAASVYKVLFPIGIVLGLIGIIGAGYSYMTSQGDPSKVKEANEKLTSAILGTLFIVLSLVILRVIINVLL